MTLSNQKPPENFLLTAQMEITIDAAAAGEASDGRSPLPRFSMVAYTGGTMRIAGWRHPVVVDLAGLAIPSQARPIRFGHDANSGVGHSDSIRVEGGNLIATGVISRDTGAAREVVASSKNGFPWQASIGASVEQFEFVKENESVIVNGRGFIGPLNVVRKSVLGEISFVDLGADGNTSASVAASAAATAVETASTSSASQSPQNQEKNPMTITAVAGETTSAAGTNTQADTNTPATTVQAGMASTATAHTSAITSSPAAVVASTSTDDPVTQMRQRIAAETRRIDAIRALCAGKHSAIEARAIEEGWDTSRTELEVLRDARPKVANIGASRPASTPQVFEAAGLMAAGMSMSRIEATYAEPVLEAANRMRGVGIQEFCEIVCGQQLPRFRSDASGWLQAAFSTASLPGILSNIANKMLLEGYNYVEDAWRRIAKIASVNDFKEHSRYRMTGGFTFVQVGADGELKHGKIDEMKFGQKADTHGIMFSLTRQMIINDDMGAFTDIPRQIGMGAAEAIADAVWGLWLRNPVCNDGKPFFSADHRNFAAGADTALTVDGLTKAEVVFGEQAKPNGRPLGIPASILLVPTALKVPAEMLMKSVLLNENTTTPKPSANPHTGKFEVVSSVYLSSAAFTGHSSKAWYLLSDPNRLPAIEIAFLNGVDRPTVEKTDADFNTLGIAFRGYIDFGVREQDFRGALKMQGF